DRLLDLREGRQLGGLDRTERLDDVVAELGLHRMRDLTRPHEERGLVERRDRLALRDRELAAQLLRARVLRVLLRERGEVGAVLNLRVERVGERLALDQDVRNVSLLRRAVLRLVLV